MTAILIDFNKALEERVSGTPELVVPIIPSQETKPSVTIAVIDTVALTRSCIVLALRDPDHAVVEFNSVESVNGTFSLVILYHHNDQSEAETLLHTQMLQEHGLVVLIGDSLSTDTVRDALDLGIKAYIPGSNDLDHVRNILNFVLTGGVFIPPSLLGKSSARNPERPFGLTERELLIIKLMHIGKQNKVIAYELGLSESTVKVHIRHILTKLNARNRTEAVSVAIKHGVVSQ